jgi:putative spermidine/putrescine transport system ATP-binding protein
MYGGRAEQVGTPFEIYNRPATSFVANFVGTLNVLDGIVADVATSTIKIGEREITLATGALGAAKAGDAVSLALRPEAIALGKQPGRDASLAGQIADVSFLGSVIRVKVSIGSNAVSLDTFNNPSAPPPIVGEQTEISFSASDLLILH